MAKQTASAHPQVMSNQSPAELKGVAVFPAAVRPDPIKAQSIATTPSPKQIRTKQPKNSAQSSPIRPCRQ